MFVKLSVSKNRFKVFEVRVIGRGSETFFKKFRALSLKTLFIKHNLLAVEHFGKQEDAACGECRICADSNKDIYDINIK